MKRIMHVYLAWPMVALGALLAAACLAGVWYINKLEADLGRAVQYDVKRLQAAEEMQIWLRQLRFHSILYAAQPNDDRRNEVVKDEEGFASALADFRKAAESQDDAKDANKISVDYETYQSALESPMGHSKVAFKGAELLDWADAHPVKGLLTTCRELADRQQVRMNRTLEKSEFQNRWAGGGLLAIGLVGVCGGLLSGYSAARRYSRAVGLLSVRVQAAQSHLDQEVGTLTVAAPQHLGELDQQLERVVARIQDMCRRFQEQEREILRSEHLAAVGQLAAGIAHEVRNPLTGIKFLIEAALRPEAATSLTSNDLALIHHEILRMERTVQELLNYSRAPALQMHDEDVRELVNRAAEIARGRADKQGVVLSTDVPETPLKSPLDRDQFLSMLTNLLFNALDVTPPGGHVRLAVARTRDGTLRIDVSDSGPGIAPAAFEKLFTPFATTKPTGTGLGLTMARRIARDHGGSLTAANRPEGGACFTFTLPQAETRNAETARGR
jgi:two-component system, NtrC family, sensor histidine kinase HydH